MQQIKKFYTFYCDARNCHLFRQRVASECNMIRLPLYGLCACHELSLFVFSSCFCSGAFTGGFSAGYHNTVGSKARAHADVVCRDVAPKSAHQKQRYTVTGVVSPDAQLPRRNEALSPSPCASSAPHLYLHPITRRRDGLRLRSSHPGPAVRSAKSRRRRSSWTQTSYRRSERTGCPQRRTTTRSGRRLRRR